MANFSVDLGVEVERIKIRSKKANVVQVYKVFGLRSDQRGVELPQEWQQEEVIESLGDHDLGS